MLGKLSIAICFLAMLNPGIQKAQGSIVAESKILDYQVLVKNYYHYVADQVSEPTKSESEFIYDFYNVYENGFCDYLIEFANDNDVELDFTFDVPTTRSSSGSEAYIISASKAEYDKETTSVAFDRQPIYKAYDYSNIKDGDIFVETKTKYPWIGHCGIISDIDKKSASYGTYVQTIEAVPNNVSFGFLDDWRIINYGIQIYRPKTNGNTSISNNAIQFTANQIGKKYSARLSIDIKDESKWYCSELVYAAYYKYGLDVSKRYSGDKEISVDKGSYLNAIFPADIASSSNVSSQVIDDYFLELSINSKNDNLWGIKARNKTDNVIGIIYNTKMCNLDDAKSWTNLDNIRTLAAIQGETRTLGIYENFSATSIAISYTASYMGKQFRLISYADNLDSSNKSLNTYHNIIF